MYSTKLFYAIEGKTLEKEINQFLWTHDKEIDEVVSVSINNAPKSYIACLMYKQKNVMEESHAEPLLNLCVLES